MVVPIKYSEKKIPAAWFIIICNEMQLWRANYGRSIVRLLLGLPIISRLVMLSKDAIDRAAMFAGFSAADWKKRKIMHRDAFREHLGAGVVAEAEDITLGDGHPPGFRLQDGRRDAAVNGNAEHHCTPH